MKIVGILRKVGIAVAAIALVAVAVWVCLKKEQRKHT